MVNDNNPPLASTTSDSGTLLVYPLWRKWLYATFRVKYLKSGSEQLYTNKFDSCKKLENSSIHYFVVIESQRNRNPEQTNND